MAGLTSVRDGGLITLRWKRVHLLPGRVRKLLSGSATSEWSVRVVAVRTPSRQATTVIDTTAPNAHEAWIAAAGLHHRIEAGDFDHHLTAG